MTINEFIQKYNLHDSLLEKVDYDEKNKSVKLEIDFCYWQQLDYTDDMPETWIITIEFIGVNKFDFTPYQINSDEIVEISHNEKNEIALTVMNDISGKYMDLIIHADDVTVKTI